MEDNKVETQEQKMDKQKLPEKNEQESAAQVGNRKSDNRRNNRRNDSRSRNRRKGGFRKSRRRNKKQDPIKDEVVNINRVAKTVKGGRNIRFTAVVVAGDGKGRVGMGTGKAAEVPDAIRKANQRARKNLQQVPISGTTIPHVVIGEYSGGKILMKPAPEGTGVIAGGPVRVVCTLAGIKDVRTKSLGSSNPKNMVEATFDALNNLTSLEETAKKRGKSIAEIIG